MNEKLNTDKMIEKLSTITKLAKDKEKSHDIVERIGIIAVYSASVDHVLIQAARLVEQIILKSHLAEGKEIKFQPHEDDWFYDQQIKSRRIMSEIKKILSLQAMDQNDINITQKISDFDKKIHYRWE